MTDRAFLKTFSGLLAALVALAVVLFVVAQMVSGSGKAKTKVAQTDAEIAARIKPVGELVVASAAVVANGVIPTANAADGKGTYDKNRRFQGEIDEVAIFDMALTVDDIRIIYRMGNYGQSLAP